jgi:cell division protein FtsN
VQVYASRQSTDAEGVVRRLAGADLAARLVRGDDGMHRVRLGPFTTEPSARDAAERARRAVGGQPFLVRQP